MPAAKPRAPNCGNLKQRALAAAHRMLEAHGEAGLTLRALAAELQTGPGSLYHHFANKDALLAELAVDGFRELGRWMAMATPPEGRTTFFACGHAYLGFTRHRPALYAIMYNERVLVGHECVRRAEAEAFEIHRRSLENLGVAEQDLADVALAFWALGRGMASISCRLGGGSPGVAKQIALRVMSGLEALTDASLITLDQTISEVA
jgi:AcrR family transcriptional regulator